MPSASCAGASAFSGSTLTRTTAVRMCASLTVTVGGQLMETSAAPAITIASSPGFTPRLLGDQGGQAREDFAAYRGLGGYQPLADADELLA